MPRVAEYLGLKFEKRFLIAASEFLRCRLVVLGGEIEAECPDALAERVRTPEDLEGALLGMLDWRGEMQILLLEFEKAQECGALETHQGVSLEKGIPGTFLLDECVHAC